MKTFTCPCFVKVENKDTRKLLREYLRNLGYTIGHDSERWSDGTEWYDMTSVYVIDHIAVCDMYLEQQIDDCGIDCGTNLELFKALSAMNNIDDYMQWFICTDDYPRSYSYSKIKEGDWYLSRHNNINKNVWRKATKEEIVEHFNNK